MSFLKKLTKSTGKKGMERRWGKEEKRSKGKQGRRSGLLAAMHKTSGIKEREPVLGEQEDNDWCESTSSGV